MALKFKKVFLFLKIPVLAGVFLLDEAEKNVIG